MQKLFSLILAVFVLVELSGQTLLTEAVDFHVKTVEGETIKLFSLLDDENKIVVIDFFSTTCGPCQDYADDFQAAYEAFGSNEDNVFFVAINYGDNNDGVIAFDSIYGVTLPSVSGLQGGGDYVYIDYEVQSYPSVIVITPDHQIVEQHVWPPTTENIIDAVYEAGGIMVGMQENTNDDNNAVLFPNPVREKAFLRLEAQAEGQLTYVIYNMIGNKLTTSALIHIYKGSNTIELNSENLKNGSYFVSYQIGNGKTQIARFMVVR